MAPWHILLGISVILAIAIGTEAWIKRNRPRRPLAERMRDPEGVATAAEQADKLGMEATDLDVMDEALRANARTSMVSSGHMARRNPFATFRAHRPRPMPEDETYAKLYHNAFHKSERGEKE